MVAAPCEIVTKLQTINYTELLHDRLMVELSIPTPWYDPGEPYDSQCSMRSWFLMHDVVRGWGHHIIDEECGPHHVLGMTASDHQKVLEALELLATKPGVALPRHAHQARWALTHWAVYRGYLQTTGLMQRSAATVDGGDAEYWWSWPPQSMTWRAGGPEFRPGIGLTVYWTIVRLSGPEMWRTGIAVSKLRNKCDPYETADSQDMDMFLARAICADSRADAVDVYDRLFTDPGLLYPGGRMWLPPTR
jgi:hypothetical protein